jgi:outer membrane protein TolC
MKLSRFSTRILALGAGLAASAAVAAPPRAQEQTSRPITLKEVVELALKNSREVALARAQYAAARSDAGVRRAEFRPNLYTGSGLAYTNGFPGLPGGQPPSVFNLSYTQDVYDPPMRGQLHAAEQRAQNQGLELDKARDAVMVRAAADYLDLGNVRHILELLRSERESGQKILDVTRKRAAAGLELPIEITRAELTLARIEQRIVQLEGRDAALDEELHDLTGIPSTERLDVSPSELPAYNVPAASDLVSMALQSSDNLKEAENERTADQEILKGNRGGFFPTFSLVGQYTVLSKINNYNQFYNAFQRNNVNVGIQIQIPLFSARTSASVVKARSDLNAADLMLDNTRRQTVIDTRGKAQSLREAEAGREVARLDLQLAQQSEAVLQDKFNQGRATLRDLAQAQLDQNEKWVTFLNADFARQQAQLALLQQTGQLAKLLQ